MQYTGASPISVSVVLSRQWTNSYWYGR